MEVIKDVEVSNRDGMIKIYWNWCIGNEVCVAVYAKLMDETSSDYGELIIREFKKLSYAIAKVEIPAGEMENGIYQLTFVPEISGRPEETGIVVLDNVYLGSPRCVKCFMEQGSRREKGMVKIQFFFEGKCIPGEQLCVLHVQSGRRYPFFGAIFSGDSFLMKAEMADIKVEAKETFARGYQIHNCYGTIF